jgi:hypothetical protein
VQDVLDGNLASQEGQANSIVVLEVLSLLAGGFLSITRKNSVFRIYEDSTRLEPVGKAHHLSAEVVQ